VILIRFRFALIVELSSGIALFTYHKYRKSLETAVPLDAHGNPISVEHAVTGTVDGRTPSHLELDETARLTRGSDEFNGVRLAR
jgi:hypothetical protein